MPAEGQRRPEVVALGGVVVDHVEDHLDPGLVQRLHHGLELLHLVAAVAGGGVGVVRREEPDGVVAPVVRQTLVQQRRVLDELMHRHQLDGGDAEPAQVVDDRRVGHAGVGAALVLGHLRVPLGQTLDVRLVDDAVHVGDPRRPVAGPVEERVDDDAVHHVRRGVVVVDRVGVTAHLVGEECGVPVDGAGHGLGVRVEQQLVRVAPEAPARIVRAVHPVAVALARLHVGQVAVPDVGVHLRHGDPGFAARVHRTGRARPSRPPR